MQLSNLQFASTSLGGAQKAPAIRIGAKAQDTILVNIRCEEFGGPALASYCVQADKGAARIQVVAVDAHYVQLGPFNGIAGSQAR